MVSSGAVQAQSTYPTRPVRLLVGFAPGGVSDNVARIIAAELSKKIGQQVIVENKTGATGNIAAQAVVAAPADGHTLFFSSFSMTSNPALMNVGYDPEKDLVMVTQFVEVPIVVIAQSKSPINNLQDLIATAKAKPGTFKIGSGGIGTSAHFAAELMSRSSGFEFTHVPYRGGAPALQALFAGEIDVMFDFMNGTLKSNMEAGNLKVLGVMQMNASPLLPNVKPASAQGIPASAFIRSWQGIGVRGGTSPVIIDKLHANIVDILNDKEVLNKLVQLGCDVHVSKSPAEFQAFYNEELARWKNLVKSANIKAAQ